MYLVPPESRKQLCEVKNLQKILCSDGEGEIRFPNAPFSIYSVPKIVDKSNRILYNYLKLRYIENEKFHKYIEKIKYDLSK